MPFSLPEDTGYLIISIQQKAKKYSLILISQEATKTYQYPIGLDWPIRNQARIMITQTKDPRTESEDIDLILLIERTVLFFRKYFWAFLVAIVAGILLGLCFYRILPTVYSSRMIVHSFMLTNQEEIQIVSNWGNLLKKKEYEALADALHCREEALHRVKSIKAEEIQKVYNASNPNGFIIDVTITDNSILPELQSGIIYGFENNEYVKDRLTVKRANLQEMIDKTNTEIQKLDSTKRILDGIMAGTGRASSSLIIDAPAVTRQQIDLNEKLLSYKESLKFSNAVQVLQSFNKFKKPTGPKLMVWLFIGLVFCLCLAFVFTLLHSVKMRLKRRADLRDKT